MARVYEDRAQSGESNTILRQHVAEEHWIRAPEYLPINECLLECAGIRVLVDRKPAQEHVEHDGERRLSACFETVRRWRVKAESAVTRVRPVEIVVDRAPVIDAPSTLKIVTPNGLRIEEARIEEVVTLVRALG